MSDGSGLPREPVLYVNGEYVPRSRAVISVFDHVVLYGDGVYDTLCAWNYALFKLDQHVDRLYESAHAVMLSIPLEKGDLKGVVIETVRRSELRNAYVKIVVTRGVGLQPLLSPYECTPGIIVFAVPYLAQAGRDGGAQGIRMITSPIRRVPNDSWSTKIKSCNYLNHVLVRLNANERGADDGLELDMEGYVCEAPGYNVFMVRDGRLLTPCDDILMGITRGTVMELAEEVGIPVITARIQPFDLYNAHEMFLSSTAGGIVPVVELDRRRIGRGCPGPVTVQLRARYEALLESGVQRTPVRPAGHGI